MDIPDEPRLTLGILDAELADDAAGRATAEEILNHRGSSARVDKNALVVVAADSNGISCACHAARALAAMRDIPDDRARLKRFNQEQRQQLAARLSDAEARLPQEMGVISDGGYKLGA